MKTKEILINNLHKIVRKDEFINAILNPAGLHLDKLKNRVNLIQKEFLFSTMSLERIKALEKELSYKTNSTTLEGKRIEIEARWKTSGKCDLNLLQAIADAWEPGAMKLEFINGDIQINFSSNVTYNVINIVNSINKAKPAHLGTHFIYKEFINGTQHLNCFNTIEIEEDFIEKNINKEINLNSYLIVYQEVIEEYGL